MLSPVVNWSCGSKVAEQASIFSENCKGKGLGGFHTGAKIHKNSCNRLAPSCWTGSVLVQVFSFGYICIIGILY